MWLQDWAWRTRTTCNLKPTPHVVLSLEDEVQHLIERCLLLGMNRDDCVKALAHHASIRPLITLTVWKELLKENRNFFQTYFHSISPRPYNCRPSYRSSRFKRKKTWK